MYVRYNLKSGGLRAHGPLVIWNLNVAGTSKALIHSTLEEHETHAARSTLGERRKSGFRKRPSTFERWTKRGWQGEIDKYAVVYWNMDETSLYSINDHVS